MDTRTPLRPHRHTALTIAGLLVGATLLTGCAADVRAAEDGTSAAPAAAGSDTALDKVVSAWEQASGQQCPRAVPEAAPGLDFLDEIVMCDNQTLVATYTRGDAKVLTHKGMTSMLDHENADQALVSTEQWTLLAEGGVADQVQEELGGTLHVVLRSGEVRPREELDVSGESPTMALSVLTKRWEALANRPCKEQPDTDRVYGQLAVDCTEDALLMVYSGPEEVQEHMDVLKSMWSGSSAAGPRLVGENWSVTEDPGVLADLQEVIGGEIIELN